MVSVHAILPLTKSSLAWKHWECTRICVGWCRFEERIGGVHVSFTVVFYNKKQL